MFNLQTIFLPGYTDNLRIQNAVSLLQSKSKYTAAIYNKLLHCICKLHRPFLSIKMAFTQIGTKQRQIFYQKAYLF